MDHIVNRYAFPWGAYHPLRWPLWTEWLTDRCKNITLPQTSFAGGKNREKCGSYCIKVQNILFPLRILQQRPHLHKPDALIGLGCSFSYLVCSSVLESFDISALTSLFRVHSHLRFIRGKPFAKQCVVLYSGSIHTCDLLGVNYLLNKGLYCMKCAHSHLLFGQLLHGLKRFMIGCVPIFLGCVLWKVHAIVHG